MVGSVGSAVPVHAQIGAHSGVFCLPSGNRPAENDSPLEEDGFEPLVPPWKRGGVFPEKGLFNTGHGSRRVHEGGPTGEFRIESLDDSTARFPPLTCAGAIARFSGTPPGSAIHPAVPDAHGRRGAGSSRLLGGRAGPRSRVAAARR